VGGGCRSAELTLPGFVHDVCSSFYPMAVASPALRRLGLEHHGLRWREAPTVLAHPALDGSCPVLERDPGATATVLDGFAPGDGEAWLDLVARWARWEEPMLDVLLGPFPPVRAGLRLAARTRRDLPRVLRTLLLPVRRLGEEEFRSPQARRLLAGAALHADLAPEAPLSALYALVLCMMGHRLGWPVPEGGAGRLADALVARFCARGGDLRCERPVVEVVVRGGRAVGARTSDGEVHGARRAVVADVSAPALYRHLVGEEHLPARLREDLERFQWDHGTVKVDWALDRPIPWSSPQARLAGTVHVAEDVDELTGMEADLVRGRVPADPFLLVGQYAAADLSRAPAGRETAWAYTHVPQRQRSPKERPRPPLGRDEVERLADRMQARVEALAPGFESTILARHVLGPTDLEGLDANLVGGAVGGGTSQLHQQLLFRPTPGWGRPSTPVRRLYLGSASAHPGGGVHVAAGANAARAALARARLPG
jgi:phytoene dehydrogenase-like protein